MTAYQEGFDTAVQGRWPSAWLLKDRDYSRGYTAGRREILRTAEYRNSPVPDTDRMDQPRGKKKAAT